MEAGAAPVLPQCCIRAPPRSPPGRAAIERRDRPALRGNRNRPGRGDGRARPDHAADPGDRDRPVAGLVLPADDAARRGDDHRRAARDDGRALVRAARERAAAARAHARELCADRRRACSRCVVATLVGGFGGGLDVPAAAAVLPGRPVVGLVGERCSSSASSSSAPGFCVYCIDVLEQTTTTYGGLAPHARLALPARSRARGAAAAGDRRHRRRDRRADLLRRRIDDPGRPARPHLRPRASASTPWSRRTSSTSSATRSPTCSIYLAAAAIYVLVPRYAGRPYETTKVFVAGWMGSLVFIATAYSHHLYMDFVQPTLGGHHLRRSPRTAR